MIDHEGDDEWVCAVSVSGSLGPVHYIRWGNRLILSKGFKIIYIDATQSRRLRSFEVIDKTIGIQWIRMIMINDK